MTLLLVDDEKITLTAICARTDWMALGIDTVRQAQSASEARAVFQREPVNLLVCDIEMPGESGLSLVRWVRVEYPETVCLLLTGHAEFAYARQAVGLGAFEYLLKPFDMEQLASALQRAHCEFLRRQNLLSGGRQWERNRGAVEEQFWTQLVLGRLPQKPEQIERYIQTRGLDVSIRQPKRLVLCTVRQMQGAMSAFQAAELDYAFKNMLKELFSSPSLAAQVLSISATRKLTLSDAALTERELRELCERFFAVMVRHFKAQVCFYVAKSCLPVDMPQAYKALTQWETQNVAYENRVFFAPPDTCGPIVFTAEQSAGWKKLLYEQKQKALTEEMAAHLDSLVNSGRMTRDMLVSFYNETISLMGIALSERNISPGPAMERLGPKVENAFSSVQAMQALLKDIVQYCCELLTQAQGSETVVDKVCVYIRQHIQEDISRDRLAQYVHLNASYLSRLFHAQMGMSLVDYVTSEKIRNIQQLLRTTDLSVSDIAQRYGYTNMPYFSQVFKRVVGVTPLEYRRSK